MTTARATQEVALTLGDSGGSKARATQEVALVIVPPTQPARATQEVALVAGESGASQKARATQEVALVLVTAGSAITFSNFQNDTDFTDWATANGGTGVDPESYMETYFISPEDDQIDWSAVPYLYMFLKDGLVSNNSLKTQARWDWSKSD